MIEFGDDLSSKRLSEFAVNVASDDTLNGYAVFYVDADSFDVPQIGDKHPKDDRLECIDFEYSNYRIGIHQYKCRYFGIAANSGRSRKIWSYGTSMSEEAIESHPDASILIGTKDSKQNGAEFDKDGVFIGFNASSIYAGIRGYLAPTTTLRSTWYDTQATSGVDTIGRVFNFTTPVPGLSGSGRNALKTGWSSEEIGISFYRITEEFLLSEKDSTWKTGIYGSPVNV